LSYIHEPKPMVRIGLQPIDGLGQVTGWPQDG
jgi:hypothetical protein